jgi:hypothetical protein
MDKVTHKVSKSEIDYGIISLRVKDGTRGFFKDLPDRFTVYVKGEKITKRRISAKKIWIGFSQMEKFIPNSTATLSKKNNDIIFE